MCVPSETVDFLLNKHLLPQNSGGILGFEQGRLGSSVYVGEQLPTDSQGLRGDRLQRCCCL